MICCQLPAFTFTPADSMSFQILPAGKEQDKVRIHCSDGDHAGKYLLVNSNNEVVAETAADEDTSTHFLRQNIGGSSTLLTITLSPVNVPTHYVAFHADSGKAQLEKELTDRSKLELMNTQFRDQKQGVTTEGLGDVIELPGGN